MFFLRPPDDRRLQQLLDEAVGQPFTFDRVGMTLEDPGQAPPGFQRDHAECSLGHGRAVFDRARAAVVEFGHYPTSFTRILRRPGSLAPDLVFGALIRHLGFHSFHPCRVIEVEDHEHAYAFSLSTLPGHAEVGEERFRVTCNPTTHEVRYSILAYSRPAHPLARLGKPIARRLQRRFQVGSMTALLDAAGEAEATR